MTDWTKPAAYEKPRRRKKKNARGGWLESAVLLAAFFAGLA